MPYSPARNGAERCGELDIFFRGISEYYHCRAPDTLYFEYRIVRVKKRPYGIIIFNVATNDYLAVRRCPEVSAEAQEVNVFVIRVFFMFKQFF